jgi:hypothetical protein
MKRFFILALFLAMPLSLSWAKEESPAQQMTVNYKASWGGISVGDMSWFLETKEAAYRSTFSLHSKGLFDKLFRLYADGESKGALVKNLPKVLTYAMKNIRGKRERLEGWLLDPKNKTEVKALNPSDENRFSPDLRKNTLDPLAAIAKLRQFVKNARETQKLESIAGEQMPVYDGRRRFDLTVQTPREDDIKVNKKNYKVLAAEMDVKPIAGIKDEDMDAWSKTKITFYFTDDGLYVPVKAVVASPLSSAIITLSGGCAGPQPCAPESRL